MRPEQTLALLPALVVVGLSLVAIGTQSSRDKYDIVREDADEATDVAPGDSRTSIGGENLGEKMPDWKSVLWCQKIRNPLDGHMCGWMLFLTDRQFLAHNDAVWIVQDQVVHINENWTGPPAAWRRYAPVVLNIKDDITKRQSSDWKYQFTHVKTLGHGIGIHKLVGHESLVKGRDIIYTDDWGNPEKPDNLFHYAILNRHFLRDECNLTVYGSETDKNSDVRPQRKLYAKKESCDKGLCEFTILNRGADKDKAITSQICGQFSDVGAPVSCHSNLVTHVISQRVGLGDDCSNQFSAIDLNYYSKDLAYLDGWRRLTNRRNDPTKPPPTQPWRPPTGEPYTPDPLAYKPPWAIEKYDKING